MNVYYEIADQLVDQFASKYLVQHDIIDESQIYINVMRVADKAWAEEGSRVRLIKNRYTGILNDDISDKEFFWVKLRSTPYSQSSQWKV